ncbi:hypothetical protein Hanom_Chr10g00913021 [Helianthus anomalus]
MYQLNWMALGAGSEIEISVIDQGIKCPFLKVWEKTVKVTKSQRAKQKFTQRINSEHYRGTHWTKWSTPIVTHPPVGTTINLAVKPVWLKDPTQVSLGLVSLSTNVSPCTKCELNLHLPSEMQVFHHLIFIKFWL